MSITEILLPVPKKVKRKKIVLEQGKIPTVNFSKKELYKITEKYIHLKITSSNLVYIPSYQLIKKSYLLNNHNLSYLIGSESHTEYAYELYRWHLERLKPTEDEYHYFLKKVAKKLFYLKNSCDAIANFFIKYLTEENPNIPYPLDESQIYDVVNVAEMEHQKNPYKPNPKCVVFNPYKDLNSTYKQVIQQKEIGKLNTKNIKELHKQNLSVQEMAEENKTSTRTVKRHLQKLGISMKGTKKENTINQIKSYRKKHPKSTQKQVSEALNLSIRTIKSNW